MDTAVAAGSFNTLATALTKAGLVDALKGDGPFTVFAPTDEAFAKLPKGTLDDLLKPENKGRLSAILTYHVVSGRVPAEKALKLTNAKTLNGQQIDLVVKNGGLTIDGAKVVKTDIECSNGVIHIIDSVILPSDKNIVATAQAAGTFKTLIAALTAADLATALQGDGPFTVFAPTDEAFAKLPKGTLDSLLKSENKEKLASILKLHVASGRAFATDALAAGKVSTLQKEVVRVRMVDGKARVNDANIVKTDIDASNGVIHVIDTVLMPHE
ncbi:MAG: fasciclin domain-containing protein [Phycisphaerae bacterium]|nr:fasciclin domain-containing protein [Phycisphaerae bacterium]